MNNSRLMPLTLCLLLVLLGLAAAAQGEDDRSIGFVLEMAGNWTVNGTALRMGQALPPGGELRAARANSRQASSHVAVVLLDSKVIRLACAKDKPCDPYRLPASLVKSSSLFERISAAAANLFGERPERYTPTITRSEKDAPERYLETVVKLEDGKVGIAPLMRGLPDGQYGLSFRRTSEADAGTSGVPVAFQWQSTRDDLPVSVDQLSPGLYSVTIRALAESDESCKTENGWTLVVAGQDYDRASNDLRQIRDAVSSWQGVSEAGKRSFLRVSLEVLSRQYK